MNTKLYKNTSNRILLMIVLALCISFSPIITGFNGYSITANAEDAVIPITASTIIDSEGSYKLSPSLTDAVITISTSDPVRIIGNGTGKGTKAESNNDISIQCTTANVNITIKDLFITKDEVNSDIINFTAGNNNYLTIEGKNLLEYNTGYGDYSVIHVPPQIALTINGQGILYYYKNQAGSAIGGNNKQANGKITFDGPTFFGKGTKQGANIGTGANAKGTTPGDIIFESGHFTLITNSRGALIGGGAGADGGAAGGNVYVNGGTFNLNVDYSGAAIGGGGYKEGNDSGGGNVFFSGGSIRTFIDKNTIDPNEDGLFGDSLWPGVTQYGVNDIAITATKLNLDGDPVALLKFNTDGLATPARYFEAYIDETEVYTGGRHLYKFIQEDFGKTAQYVISNTFDNWVPLETEDNIYLYVTKSEHELIVNDELFYVEWNDDEGTFVVTNEAGEVIEPDVHSYPEEEEIDDPEEPIDVPELGDLNGDGILTVNDIILGISAIMGTDNLTDAQFIAADVDEDGMLTINDIILIITKIMGN